MVQNKAVCVKFAKTCLAAALALGAATTAEAARNWTGNGSGNFQTSGNWSSTSGRRYFKDGTLHKNGVSIHIR